jgi:hypothetical protein
MNDTMKILVDEQEIIKVQANLWETKMRKVEIEHNVMGK